MSISPWLTIVPVIFTSAEMIDGPERAAGARLGVVGR
jgi:hypothetical protein